MTEKPMFLRRLRLLLVEDNEDDATLIVERLRHDGYEPVYRRVDTREEYVRSLQEDWEIIISDYSLPEFNGLEALKILNRADKDIPFIMVSGVIDDADAVEALRNGARDFISKDDYSRLAPAIRRELQEVEIRKNYIRAGISLKRIELDRLRTKSLLSAFMQVSRESFSVYDEELRLLEATDVFIKEVGMNREEAISRNLTELLPDLVRERRIEPIRETLRTGRESEFMMFLKTPTYGPLPKLIKVFRVGPKIGMSIRDARETDRRSAKQSGANAN